MKGLLVLPNQRGVSKTGTLPFLENQRVSTGSLPRSSCLSVGRRGTNPSIWEGAIRRDGNQMLLFRGSQSVCLPGFHFGKSGTGDHMIT